MLMAPKANLKVTCLDTTVAFVLVTEQQASWHPHLEWWPAICSLLGISVSTLLHSHNNFGRSWSFTFPHYCQIPCWQLYRDWTAFWVHFGNKATQDPHTVIFLSAAFHVFLMRLAGSNSSRTLSLQPALLGVSYWVAGKVEGFDILTARSSSK